MTKTFAVIDEEKVVNLIVADSLELAEQVTQLTCVEFYSPVIGDEYIDSKFIPQVLTEEELV